MATLLEILKKPLDERKGVYGSNDISKIKIDGEEFKGYKTFSSFWEKTYKDEPSRSIAGVIDNLNSYPTFTTFHIIINYSMMSIDDYRRLYKLMLSKNEFIVTAYDTIKNMPYTCKMYFAPDQMPKLYAMARKLSGDSFVEVLGVQDYTIELIGTNSGIETIDIIFKDENNSTIYTKEARPNEEIEIYYNYQPLNEGYEWYGVWQISYDRDDIEDKLIVNGDVIVPSEYGIITETGESFVNSYKYMILKPVLVGTKKYKLSFDFGIGIPPTPLESETFPTNINIDHGYNISQAVSDENISIEGTPGIFIVYSTNISNITRIKTPNVVYNGKEYLGEDAYSFLGWTLVKDATDLEFRILATTTFDYDYNRTIYALFRKRIYNVLFSSPDSDLQFDTLTNVPYDSDVIVPFVRKNGKKLVWYWKDGDTEVEFNGKMPPFVLNLYGKWVDE